MTLYLTEDQEAALWHLAEACREAQATNLDALINGLLPIPSQQHVPSPREILGNIVRADDRRRMPLLSWVTIKELEISHGMSQAEIDKMSGDQLAEFYADWVSGVLKQLSTRAPTDLLNLIRVKHEPTGEKPEDVDGARMEKNERLTSLLKQCREALEERMNMSKAAGTKKRLKSLIEVIEEELK